MRAKGWVILILVLIAVFGVAFLYFYSPTRDPLPSPTPTPSPTLPPMLNQTFQFNQSYTGSLNGTLYGYMIDGIVSNQYIGAFNGSFNGYGWINNQPVYLSVKIASGNFNGIISGQRRETEFQGQIYGYADSAVMQGLVTYLPPDAVRTPITLGSFLRRIWWVFLLIILLVVIIWFMLKMGGYEEIERHSVTDIDLSVRPMLEDEPYDKQIRRFIRSRPVPNAIKPKYHQLLYQCSFPNGEYILVDAKYNQILRVYTDISASDIRKAMDETTFSSGQEQPMPYGRYSPRYRRSSRKSPPPSPSDSGLGEFDSGGEFSQ